MSSQPNPQEVVTTVDLEQYGFKKVASGKVREIFEVDANTLLFVATDRISAYDVIMANVSVASFFTTEKQSKPSGN